MDVLRVSTAGSVDDGKSTLIGRLLHDTHALALDQLAAVEDASARRGDAQVNLALVTDGLRAEREQNITIDVAYRYFSTSKRTFILADTPGHESYTRNMVTGASTAELALILVDARAGVQTQSRRHAFVSSLLGIPHMVVAVNKMDLVEWSEAAFEGVVAELTEFGRRIGARDLTFVPICALHGDNVVEKSERMPWYGGSTLLHHLEHVTVGAHRNVIDLRFPVQYVLRADPDYRGYAGRVASGTLRPGEELLVLPSKQRTRITSVTTPDGERREAGAGDAVVVTTEQELDIGRGDMLVRPLNLPIVDTELDATLCWTGAEPLRPDDSYWLRTTTREVLCHVSTLVYRIDVDTLHRAEADTLSLNDIGRARITTAQPIVFDRYEVNRETGAFILVDRHTHDTVAAGMIRGAVRTPEDLPDAAEPEGGRPASPSVVWEGWNVGLEERERRNGHPALVVWFTGLSGAGKSTLARRVERRLFDAGVQTMLLDGDQVRHGLNGDLAFSDRDRRENIRRVGEVAALFFRQGCVTLCTFISPFRADRARARASVPEGRFLEVFVDTPLEECERRDPKGLYARARRGEVRSMTGVSSPYEAPTSPELHLDAAGRTVDDLVETVLAALRTRGVG